MKYQIVHSLGALTLGLAIGGVSLMSLASDPAAVTGSQPGDQPGSVDIPPPPPGPYRYETDRAPARPAAMMAPGRFMPPPPAGHGEAYEVQAEVHARSGPRARPPAPMAPARPEWAQRPQQPPARPGWAPHRDYPGPWAPRAYPPRPYGYGQSSSVPPTREPAQ